MSPCQERYLKEPKTMKPLMQMIGFAGTLLLLLTFSHAQGTLYKWTDSRGNIHYSNTPTSTNATVVDDTLPPASSFKSPTPPPEASPTSSPSSESKAAPGSAGDSTTTGDTDSPPTTETTADDSQAPPTGETTEESEPDA
jgi:hypothetical protein